MGNTVYAENMGFFHKGSGGKGIAPGDVCLTPPPPPTGPVPVPYVNMLQASDLAKGSKSVKIMGEPTALENVSNISTSTGNEAATQGGGIVTHKTKGKGSFTLWSFVVKVEGKGVCCQGHPLDQNTASTPGNIISPAAQVNFNLAVFGLGNGPYKKCPAGKEKAPKTKTTKAQRDHVSKPGNTCWSCPNPKLNVNRGVYKSGKAFNRGSRWIADHQPPQSIVWEKLGGCHNEEAFKKWKKDNNSVMPQCNNCSNSQGNWVRNNDASQLLQNMGFL